MKEIEYIVGVYRSLGQQSDEGPYMIVFLLSEQGFIESDIPQKIYAERFIENLEISKEGNTEKIGPFLTLERLNQYAFQLCEELNALRIALYSVDEYNELLENGHGAQDFFSSLLEKGNVIENIERKNKGFFNRFFS